MEIPGFIDLQVNGYAGVDFQDPKTSVDEILEVAELLAARGTAGFLATVITNYKEVMEQCVSNLTAAINKQGKSGHILGIHLEGPFISPEDGYRGVHPKAGVCLPDVGWVKKVQGLSGDNVRLITLAPELPNVPAFIKAVTPQIKVAIGHSSASFSDIRNAVGAGLSLATHIGNGCKQNINRHDNPIINVLACSEISLCFIADGFHLPEAFIRTIINSRPIDKLIVVSDSVTFAGMRPGVYVMDGDLEVKVHENGKVCVAADSNMLAGSGFNMMQCMNHLASLGILPEQNLYKVGFVNPLKAIGRVPRAFKNRKNKVVYDSQNRAFELNSPGG
jgi:N-acetylglucosamine-6-phosphate deacetylase